VNDPSMLFEDVWQVTAVQWGHITPAYFSCGMGCHAPKFLPDIFFPTWMVGRWQISAVSSNAISSSLCSKLWSWTDACICYLVDAQPYRFRICRSINYFEQYEDHNRVQDRRGPTTKQRWKQWNKVIDKGTFRYWSFYQMLSSSSRSLRRALNRIQ
jgi:hypothetical protein